MEMKEVIIDGINVAGCKYYSQVEYIQNCNGYDETPDSCSAYPDRICVNHINCYFKQLQRAKQESTRLKQLLETKCQSELEREMEKYKQALKRIKDIGLFNLNNTREKISEINGIVCEVLQ